MANVTVKLSRLYDAHDKAFDKVVLREPTYTDSHIDGLGVPQEWMPTANGMVLYTDRQAVASYIQRLAIEPTAECLTNISVVDAMRLEQAVIGFFIDTPKSAPASTGLSSDADKTLTS
jgi:hypothetical protein